MPISYDASEDEVSYRVRDAACVAVVSLVEKRGSLQRRGANASSHVWTAPLGQGEFSGVGEWSGAVMYPACWRGRLTAGPDGLRGSGSEHCGALLRRDDKTECPDPGPDHCAVAAWCSLRLSGRVARRGVGVAGFPIGNRDVTFPGRQGMFLGSTEHRFFVPT